MTTLSRIIQISLTVDEASDSPQYHLQQIFQVPNSNENVIVLPFSDNFAVEDGCSSPKLDLPLSGELFTKEW